MTGSLRGAHHEDQKHSQENVGSRRRRGRQSWGDHGASAVEYALILAACALGIIAVVFALQHSIGSALQASADSVGSGPGASCSKSDDGDSCDDEGDGDDDGEGDGEEAGPTQPAGSTAVAAGASKQLSVTVPSGYSLASPTSSACTYTPSVKPSSASITATDNKSGSTSQSVTFKVSSGASHGQAISATCTFKKGSSSQTRSFSLWIP